MPKNNSAETSRWHDSIEIVGYAATFIFIALIPSPFKEDGRWNMRLIAIIGDRFIEFAAFGTSLVIIPTGLLAVINSEQREDAISYLYLRLVEAVRRVSICGLAILTVAIFSKVSKAFNFYSGQENEASWSGEITAAALILFTALILVDFHFACMDVLSAPRGEAVIEAAKKKRKEAEKRIRDIKLRLTRVHMSCGRLWVASLINSVAYAAVIGSIMYCFVFSSVQEVIFFLGYLLLVSLIISHLCVVGRQEGIMNLTSKFNVFGWLIHVCAFACSIIIFYSVYGEFQPCVVGIGLVATMIFYVCPVATMQKGRFRLVFLNGVFSDKSALRYLENVVSSIPDFNESEESVAN